MFPCTIRDPSTGSGQRVTENGESVQGLLGHSEPYHIVLAIDAQVYNVVRGLAGKRFLMTGIFIATTRNITQEKQIDIYESLAVDSGTSDKNIITLDMIKSERIFVPLINVVTQEGRHINANAEDSEVHITIFGYYVNA